ncbi:MAG: DUF3515 domain-containing protein [Intrasporangium sp.]|uniref:DUF3515 family protein n=1 Tax=Intrasporangium sp. TaxID=1925024 RepID=UPI002647AA99|nr:DUF3515 family protein [Intrasporangium sp.]MDN5794734.1 DUF3515 domain-containing protein [Intrasporangium sp.]
MLYVLSGCSRAVDVSPAPFADSPACRSVPWPGKVSGVPRVDTSSSSPSVAAWGDPAIIARCGLAPLAPTTLSCVTVDGVDWVVRSLSDGSAATTYGTDPAIEVLVPQRYGPAPLQLPVFTVAARALPSNGRQCT